MPGTWGQRSKEQTRPFLRSRRAFSGRLLSSSSLDPGVGGSHPLPRHEGPRSQACSAVCSVWLPLSGLSLLSSTMGTLSVSELKCPESFVPSLKLSLGLELSPLLI